MACTADGHSGDNEEPFCKVLHIGAWFGSTDFHSFHTIRYNKQIWKKNWRLFASDPILNTNRKMIIQFFPLYFKLLHRSLIVQSISNDYTYTYQLTSYGYVKSDNFPFVFFFFCTHVIKQTHLTAFANNIIKNTNKTQLKIDMENSNKILHFLYVIFEFLFFSL